MNKKPRFTTLLIFCFSIGLFAQPGIYSESDIEFQSMFMDAQIEKHKGNTDKQIELLKEIIKRDKSSHAAYFELAKAFQSQENYEMAQKNALLATKSVPDNEWYNLTLAEIYESSSQFEKASETYSKMITQDPKNPIIYHKLSVNQLKSNNTDAAAATLEKLQTVTNIEEETSRRLFDIYSKSGKEKKALETLKKLSAQYPDNVRYLNNLAGYQHDLGQQEEAQKTFKKVLALDPQNAQANMAVIRTQPSRDGEASDYLSSLMPVMENMDIPLDSKIKELMPHLSKIEKGSPSASSLDEISQFLVENYPSEAKAYSVRADVLFYTGALNESEKMYSKAISLDDRKYTLWDQWMINLWQTENYKKLESVSYDAIDLFPNNVDAFVMHALALKKNNNQSESLEFLDEAKFIAGEKKSLINIIEIAKSWTSKNSDEESLKTVLTTFDKQSFTNPIYFEIIGDLFAEINDDKKSKEFWQLALDLGANESKIRKKMGA